MVDKRILTGNDINDVQSQDRKYVENLRNQVEEDRKSEALKTPVDTSNATSVWYHKAEPSAELCESLQAKLCEYVEGGKKGKLRNFYNKITGKVLRICKKDHRPQDVPEEGNKPLCVLCSLSVKNRHQRRCQIMCAVCRAPLCDEAPPGYVTSCFYAFHHLEHLEPRVRRGAQGCPSNAWCTFLRLLIKMIHSYLVRLWIRISRIYSLLTNIFARLRRWLHQ